MVILHYTLGLAPQRSGGLTRYATDLIREQSRSEQVYLLYAAGWRVPSSAIAWSDVGDRAGISCFELNNSLPVPLLYGIRKPEDFIDSRQMSREQMQGLYERIRPDVFHVHTLMGLPQELLVFFKEMGVKLIYTSHDYFGICPKVNLINERGVLCKEPSAMNCERCNSNSKPTMYLRLRNSRVALNCKSNKFLRKVLR